MDREALKDLLSGKLYGPAAKRESKCTNWSNSAG